MPESSSPSTSSWSPPSPSACSSSSSSLRHHCRELLHLNVTDHPSAVCTARQLVEAFPDDTAPRYLLRDRDGIYGQDFSRRVERMGIREARVPPRAPWQNPCVERLIGSLRRECLDHFLILSEAHLRRLLRAYGAYYNTTRPHQSLDNNSPQLRVIEHPSCGRIIAMPQVGGLHHRYQRVACRDRDPPFARSSGPAGCPPAVWRSTVASAPGSLAALHISVAKMLPPAVDD